MTKSPILLPVSFLMITLAVSCVTGGKYSSLEKTSKHFMDERDTLKTENLKMGMANRELEASIAALQKQMGSVKDVISKTEGERDKALGDYNKLSEKYNDLQNAHEDLIKGNVKETQKLLADLNAAQENLQKKEDLLRQLGQSLDSKKASLDELNFELDKRNQKLAELEKILDAQKRIVQDLKNKVSEALLGFENNGLTVTQKDGKVYISLDEKLLFRSASWEIDANGKNALRKLASVLEKNPGIQVEIEGHTDNVPYHPGNSQLIDNWDLSVKRATTVVRTLLEGSKIKPERLTAAGRSEYIPIDNRGAADARQKNRRTEIILTPDLSELYNLINKY
jgi:chemotaxis protein MotB